MPASYPIARSIRVALATPAAIAAFCAGKVLADVQAHRAHTLFVYTDGTALLVELEDGFTGERGSAPASVAYAGLTPRTTRPTAAPLVVPDLARATWGLRHALADMLGVLGPGGYYPQLGKPRTDAARTALAHFDAAAAADGYPDGT